MYENYTTFDSYMDDRNSNSDDTDSEEQKLLELEASLYSKIHYAEDIPILHDNVPSTQIDNANVDRQYQESVQSIDQNTHASNISNDSSENETHITESLYKEILKAKSILDSQSRNDEQSDSGLSSCKGDSMHTSRLEQETSRDSAEANESLDVNSITPDSKYASIKSKTEKKPKSKSNEAQQHITNDKSIVKISSSDTESSSDEDSGIRMVEQITERQQTHPIIDLESDENSYDGAEHEKFLKSIRGMDEDNESSEKDIEVLSNRSSSSDSEIELLPNTPDQFSSIITDKIKKGVIGPRLLQSQSSPNRAKNRVTVTHHDSKKDRKQPPKNVVDISTTSDSSSSDEENIIGNTTLSLNVTGNRMMINKNSENTKELSFTEMTQEERNPFSANVEQQCSMLNVSHEDIYIKNWTSEMYSFYNEVNEKDADSNLKQILQHMSDDPKLWRINSKDRCYSSRGSNGSRRYFSPRNHNILCRNCNHRGHTAKDCTEEQKPAICHMCGFTGHVSDECNQAKCLRCSAPNGFYSTKGCTNCRRLNTSMCFICGANGHVKSACPDNWRRFHATLSGTNGEVIEPFGGVDRAHKPLRQIWCCNCGKKGHYLHHCRAYNYSSYPAPVVHVINYDDLDPGHNNALNKPHDILNLTPFGNNQRRKTDIRERKAKKRAFRSLSQTPNTEQSYADTTFSTPTTPIERQSSNKDDMIKNSLEKTRATLEELLSEQESHDDSRKKWRKHKKTKERGYKYKSSGNSPILESSAAKRYKKNSFDLQLNDKVRPWKMSFNEMGDYNETPSRRGLKKIKKKNSNDARSYGSLGTLINLAETLTKSRKERKNSIKHGSKGISKADMLRNLSDQTSVKNRNSKKKNSKLNKILKALKK